MLPTRTASRAASISLGSISGACPLLSLTVLFVRLLRLLIAATAALTREILFGMDMASIGVDEAGFGLLDLLFSGRSFPLSSSELFRREPIKDLRRLLPSLLIFLVIASKIDVDEGFPEMTSDLGRGLLPNVG